FIEELVNSLLGMGVLKIEAGVCNLIGDLEQIEMPDTVQRVVLARIDQLPEAQKVTLKVASVIGRTFQRDLLHDVHPFANEESVAEDLLRLQAEDFTRKDGRENELEFLFKHVITREVAYETMLYSQRRELHATIGQAMESRARENEGEVVDLLAYHYALSDNRDKALIYLTRAGDKALLGNANEAAVSYFTQAVAVAEELEKVDDQFNLIARREQAYNRLGDRVAQGEDLDRMMDLAQAQEKEGLRILQMLETESQRLLYLTNLGQYEDAIKVAEENLNIARSTHLASWEARILTNMGITYWRAGDYEKARQSMQKSLVLATKVSDDKLKGTSYNYLGLIHTRLAEYPQARRDYQQAMEIYQRTDDKAGEAGCANNFGLLEVSLGRYEQARQHYEHALSLCQTLGDRLLEGISLNILGQVHTYLGQDGKAEAQLVKSLEVRQSIGDRRGEAFCLHDLGALYMTRDKPEVAVEYFDAAVNLRASLGEKGNYNASLAAKGEASLKANNLPVATHCLKEAIAEIDDSGSGEYPLQQVWWAYSQLCQANSHFDEMKRALQIAYDLIQARVAQISPTEYRRSYLENVPVNAAIIDAIQRSGS
ncbi:MAG: tetratricopeptide repeat protein, partial [Chloroflexota bacterium]